MVNRLSTNTEKTIGIIFSNRLYQTETIDNNNISFVESDNFLCIFIDNKLSLAQHANQFLK